MRCLGPLARLVVLVAALIGTAPAASAQDPAGAEEAARSYAAAFAEGDWEAAAALTDPLDLARFSDLVGVFAGMIGDEVDHDMAEADTPEAAFASFMDVVITLSPELEEAFRSVRTETVGSVPEGDSLIHVVTRSHVSMFGQEMSGLEVTTTRWDGSRWVVKLNEQLEGMLAGMEAGFNGMIDDDYDDEPRDPKKQ